MLGEGMVPDEACGPMFERILGARCHLVLHMSCTTLPKQSDQNFAETVSCFVEIEKSFFLQHNCEN